MPNLRRLVSQKVAGILSPRTYTAKVTLPPTDLFRGKIAPPIAGICQIVVYEKLVPHCITIPSSMQLPSTIIEAEKLPIVIRQFEIVASIAPVTIMNDIFHYLSMTRVFGMNYRDRVLRELGSQNNHKPIVLNKPGTRPLRKSYTNTEPFGKQKSKPKPPTFWDLLYVVLLPPLTLEHIEGLILPHNLFPFQPAGIDFLMKNESALLADEMGTGKTVMTVVALRILMQKGLAHCALVVCPVSVLRQWDQHLDEWSPSLLVTTVRGNQNIRTIDWLAPAHVYVTSYDTLRSDIESGVLSKLNKFDVVVLDEAQNIKNLTSKRSRAIKMLKAYQRWALTGTPIENKLDDLVSLFEYLRPGYLKPNDLYPTRIKEKINPYFLRRRKADVLPDLPEKQKQDVWLELDDAQRAEYNQVINRVRSELSELGSRVTKWNILQKVQRLKQICNFAPGNFTSPKLDSLKELLEEIIENEQKIIVFSQYLGEGIDKLDKALEPYGTAKIIGGQTDSARNREVDRFKQIPEIPILLASVRAGGVGLNLTEASYVVHFDHWWNPAVMWQAEARVHRPGQKRGVNVYSFWMEDTIEERIYGILQKKGLLFEDVVDSLSESQIDDLISVEEWLDILGVKSKEVQAPPQRETFESLSLTEIRERLYEIHPTTFEHLVRELMHSFGYPNVKVTGRTRDGGIDVTSTRNTTDGVVRAVAQCKRYRGTVGVDVARELRGVMAEDTSIQKGYLVTTGEFTRECLGFCERSGVIVPISGLQVANYIKKFGLAMDVVA